MATRLPTRPKIHLAHLPTKTTVFVTFHKLQSKTEEVVQSTRSFLDLLPLICRYHGNILSGTLKKWVLHIYNQRHTCVPSFMEIGQKLRKKFATQNFPTSWLIIYELLPWQHTFCHCQEICHADLHPKTNIQYEFHENWKNTDEAVLP